MTRTQFIRPVILAGLVALVIAGMVHDGEPPELADLIDNRLHHEKLEAWLLIAAFVVGMWPTVRRPRERLYPPKPIRAWKGEDASDATELVWPWPAAAQYVVLIATAKDRDTLAMVLEQAADHLSDVELSALEYFATNRERELGRVFET